LATNNNKRNIGGCIKIFSFLKLLYEDRADYQSVLEIFQDEFTDLRNAQVVLNKYINTLKVFGIKVKKQNGKYKLQSSLWSMNFTMDDFKAISILISSIKDFPDNSLTDEINTFLKSLLLRMTTDDKNTFYNLTQNNHYDFSFQYLEIKDQIEKCQELCNKNFILNITYKKKQKTLKTKCTPIEVIYDNKNVYLKAYDTVSRQNLEIDLTNILSIESSPMIAKKGEIGQTVVFKLKNRLAKTYKLKENEQFDSFDADGNPIYINRNEPIDKLMQRLMRYSYNCEIISPKSLKYEFIELINKTLNNYTDDEN